MTENARPDDSIDAAVCSEPVDTEDGEQIVICQQNVGPGNQVGAGEYKRGKVGRTSEEAAAEQDELEAQVPVESSATGH